MKRLFLILLVLAMAGGAEACSRRGTPRPLAEDADPAAIPNLMGEYALNGSDTTGEAYGGTLIITAGSAAGEYALTWIVTSDVSKGVAVVDGNRLVFTWQTIVEEGSELVHGEGEYTITANGELYGVRRATADGSQGNETAYPNR